MKPTLFLPLLAALPACFLTGDDDPDRPAQPLPAAEGCVQPEDRIQRIVRVSGQVVDFTTSQPVPGATVAVTTAWDTEGDIPPDHCPLLATLVTDRDGRFGPVPLYAGAGDFLPIMLFRVAGADRAVTLSDNRACVGDDEDGCDLFHSIAAPSAALAAQWRTELTAGGMADADRRGLIAFLYKDGDGTPAAGVSPSQSVLGLALRPGAEVRFVDGARGGLTPASAAATTSSGVALIGVAPGSGLPQGTQDIAGARGGERWAATGSLIVPGQIFVEDRTVSPPQQ